MSFFDLILTIRLNVHCIYSEPSAPKLFIFHHLSSSSSSIYIKKFLEFFFFQNTNPKTYNTTQKYQNFFFQISYLIHPLIFLYFLCSQYHSLISAPMFFNLHSKLINMSITNNITTAYLFFLFSNLPNPILLPLQSSPPCICHHRIQIWGISQFHQTEKVQLKFGVWCIDQREITKQGPTMQFSSLTFNLFSPNLI